MAVFGEKIGAGETNTHAGGMRPRIGVACGGGGLISGVFSIIYVDFGPAMLF